MKYLPYHSIFFAPKRGAWNHQAQESGDGHWWWLWWHRDTNVGWQMGRAVRWFRVRRWNEGHQGETFWEIWETDQWLLERDWGCLLYPPVNRCRQWKILSSMRKIDTATSCWRVAGFPSPRQKRISSNFESFCGITCPKCTDMLRYVVHPSNFGPCEA